MKKHISTMTMSLAALLALTMILPAWSAPAAPSGRQAPAVKKTGAAGAAQKQAVKKPPQPQPIYFLNTVVFNRLNLTPSQRVKYNAARQRLELVLAPYNKRVRDASLNIRQELSQARPSRDKIHQQLKTINNMRVMVSQKTLEFILAFRNELNTGQMEQYRKFLANAPALPAAPKPAPRSGLPGQNKQGVQKKTAAQAAAPGTAAQPAKPAARI